MCPVSVREPGLARACVCVCDGEGCTRAVRGDGVGRKKEESHEAVPPAKHRRGGALVDGARVPKERRGARQGADDAGDLGLMLMRIWCTSHAPCVHMACTVRAPGVQFTCTMRAYGVHYGVHRACTSRAPGVHLVCTWYAPRVHHVCTWCVPVRLACTVRAPGVHRAFTWQARVVTAARRLHFCHRALLPPGSVSHATAR